MAEPSSLDVARLVRVLEAYHVEYVLVGGVAAGAHGATRVTEDFDMVARRTAENLDRLAAAMRSLNAHLRVAGLDDEEARQLPVQLDSRSLTQMELSTWRSDAGDFDVLVGVPDRTGRVVPYDELITRAEEMRLHAVLVHTADLDDIIASKEWANRPKDQAALPELRAIQHRRSPSPAPDQPADPDEDGVV